jgi:hypothetical protein
MPYWENKWMAGGTIKVTSAAGVLPDFNLTWTSNDYTTRKQTDKTRKALVLYMEVIIKILRFILDLKKKQKLDYLVNLLWTCVIPSTWE